VGQILLSLLGPTTGKRMPRPLSFVYFKNVARMDFVAS